MKQAALALVVVLAVAVWTLYKPPAGSLVKKLRVELAAGQLLFDGETYQAEWGEPQSFTGDARLIVRMYNKEMPFFTHDLLLSSGDFSDPDKVVIKSRGGGNYQWRAQQKPAGSMLAMHLIPRDLKVLKKLRALDEGDAVELIGRKETDSKITRMADSYRLQLNHDNHAFILLEDIR